MILPAQIAALYCIAILFKNREQGSVAVLSLANSIKYISCEFFNSRPETALMIFVLL